MRQKHLTHNFSICVSRQRLIQMGCLVWDDSFAIYPPLSLEYYEAKIQILSVLSWKPALEMPWYIKIKTAILLITQIVVENLTNSTKSGKCRHLTRRPNCGYFAIYHIYLCIMALFSQK